jgi:group II intron reverse transcriptase/maturase
MIMMQVKLNQIARRAKQDKRLKFTSLIHHVNEANLAECYRELKANKACGIDGETVEAYGKNLQERLSQLVASMKSKQYRPKPVKRVYIPKAGKNEKRGLGIPSVEDKLVQIMLKKILEQIYEAEFLDVSYGFRPKLCCHDAVKALDKTVMTKPINYIVEVDIKGFFDNVNHYWLQRCLEEKIVDRNLLWLVRRFLKAGVVEDGKQLATDVGTPQGGVISPLLANIYLHYVLDLWFKKEIKSQARGHMELIRYCDDFVVCCESEKDAKNFLELLHTRLEKFGLQVSEDKTKVIKFGRQVWKQAQRSKGKVETFTFLGFTHYCGKSRQGYFVMGHKTSKENFCRKLKETKEWLKKIRNKLRLREWWPVLKSKLTGHYNYFGVSGNYRCLQQFYNGIFSIVFKWINRRSQKKSMNFDQYLHYLQWNPLPTPRICYAMY